MRKIGALLFNWNQEVFIKQHLDMITPVVDRTLVFLEQKPLKQYAKEHYSSIKDKSESIIKAYPNIEWVEGTFEGDFCADFLNRGLKMMTDCDIVIRLDSDMFLTQKDLKRFVDFIRDTNFDCYRVNWASHVINYYITGKGDFGLYDSLEEYQPMAVNPKYLFSHAVTYPDNNSYLIQWEDFRIHHLRGWKPSFKDGWQHSEKAQELIRKYGDFVKLPNELYKILCQAHQ